MSKESERALKALYELEMFALAMVEELGKLSMVPPAVGPGTVRFLSSMVREGIEGADR